VHILVVHQHYLSAGQPGGSRFNEFARLWCEAGHQVTVLAGTVNYATGETNPNYRRRVVTEEREGAVRVLRCRVPESYSKSYVGRAWAFAGFAMSSTYALAYVQRPDVIIATSPPLTTALTGAAAARRWGRRVPWIFEVRDLWPESAVTTGVLSPGSPIVQALYRIERLAYRDSSLINVLTPAFRDDIVRRGLASEAKISLIPNGADLDLFSPGERNNDLRRDLGWGDRFVVMYAGAHGRANALQQLVDTAERLRSRPEILIACVGDGPERAELTRTAKERGLENIVFHGPLPKAAMPSVVAACDVGSAVLQRNPTFRTVYPNKVFDYMACERPVLLAIDGVARKLVCEEAQAGVFVEPEDPDQIAAGILALADDPEGRAEMARRGRSWVVENASREALSLRYLSAMEKLVTARTD
jgi:glycosyltransferase involved in cell wall biosynthesis